MVDKIKYIEIAGQRYPILMSAYVYEAIEDKFGSVKEWYELISTQQKIKPILDVVFLMITSAYAHARTTGIAFPIKVAEKAPEREDMSFAIGSPEELAKILNAVADAANAGSQKEINAVPASTPGRKKKKKNR